MNNLIRIPSNLRILLVISLIQVILWSIYQIWVRPLLTVGSTEEITRSLIRVSIILIPAVIYIYKFKSESLKTYFNTQNLRHALLWGILTSLIIFVFFVPQHHKFTFPVDLTAWLNWIIGSPLAEELYFRGIVLTEASKRFSNLKSALFSTLLFTIFHLPQWVFTHSIDEYLITICMIFVYGILFSTLWLKTKSIFTALLPHSINNFLFMATSMVR